jgi:hypothetical protein
MRFDPEPRDRDRAKDLVGEAADDPRLVGRQALDLARNERRGRARVLSLGIPRPSR